MSRKMYWALGALAIMIVGFVALQIYLHIDLQNFKEEIAGSPKVETETPTTPDVVNSEGNPVDPKDDPFQPIEHPPMQITDVPNENAQTSKASDLAAKYEGKPIDENFYREYIKVYSRKALESMLKTDQRRIKLLQTVFIPEYEEIYERYLQTFKDDPNSEYAKKGLAKTEGKINQFKFEIENIESSNAMISKVLKEGRINNVEK